MIFRSIRLHRLRTAVLFRLLIAGTVSAYAALNVLFFTLVYSLIGFIILFFFLTASLAVLIIFLARKRKAEKLGLFSGLEQALFGERRLYLDSLEEFNRKKEHPGLVEESEKKLGGPKLEAWEKKTSSSFFLGSSLAVILVLVSFLTAAYLSQKLSAKISLVNRFFSYGLKSHIPGHYIESKPLRLVLTNDLEFLDRVYLVVNSNRMESSNAVFVLDEALTSLKKILLTVEGEKFGMTIPMVNLTLQSTRQLLIDHAVLTVRYPSFTGIPPEEFTGLQDLEVWEGAGVSLDGDATKKLTNARLRPGAGEKVRLENERFDVFFYPKDDMSAALELLSEDGDRAVSPEFGIKVNPNVRPTLKLLFPTGDVSIGEFQWSVQSLLEGEDDQGIRRIVVDVLVTNRDTLLKRYGYKKRMIVPCGNEKSVRKTVSFTYRELDLLPDEVASASFTAEDVFGKRSGTVGFSIIVPDLMDIQERNAKAMKKINNSVKDVSNSYNKMQNELGDKDLSGAQQQMRQMESGLSNLSDAVSDLDKNQAMGLDEIRESVQRMKEVTDSLKKNSDLMKQLLSLMQTGKEQVKEMKPDGAKLTDMNQLLKELSSMMKNLEYYKQFSDLLTQFQLTKTVYEKLKAASNENDFMKTLASYKEELKKLGGQDKVKDLAEKLQNESGNLKPSLNRKQFEKSDALMKQLEKQVQDILSKASGDRIGSKVNMLERLIEETYLYTVLIEEAMKLDYGSSSEPDLANTARAGELINSIQASFKQTKTDLDTALAGIQFGGNTMQDLENTLKDIDGRISFQQEMLKEYQVENIRPAFYYIEKSSAYLFVYLVRISAALSDATKNQQPGTGDQQMASLGMEDLLKMQNNMSMSLQNLMERMQKSGKLTPQMKEEMEALANMQEEIKKTLGQMMQKNKSGAFSGGSEMNKGMDDIIQDLKSYNVKKDTVEKSRQLEEKLLKSKKSLEAKGVGEERKAETAKVYEVKPPDRNDAGFIEKLDLGGIRDKKVSEYYKKLIERYKKR